jgi:TonB-dependent starch-binding outer membrane protein SusC
MSKQSNCVLKALCFSLLFLITISLHAQNRVTGKITNQSDNQPIAGASILEKGTTNGTVSVTDGSFSITVGNNATLVITFIGYVPEEVKVNGRNNISVALQSAVGGMNEVVVIGYGTQRKKDVSGSVASVNMETAIRRAPFNVAQTLQGSAAGVLVSAQDGAPDGNAAIRIRGIATIYGSADPLYVVDGVVVGTNANFLVPNDIASIEVLKDASATAIYGAAGANGVIMITTNHGKVGASHINVSANLGVETLSSTLKVCGIDQYAKNVRTGRANDGALLSNQIFSEAYDGKRKFIDWQRELTSPSVKQQYTLSGFGGSEKTQSNFSLSYFNNNGLIVNTNYKRLTGRADASTKVNKFLEVGGDINFIHTESHGSNLGYGNNANLSSLRDLAFWAPTMDYVDKNGVYVSPNVKNADGTYGTYLQSDVGSYDGGASDNLYAVQMENNGLTKTNQTIFSAYANIKLFKGLTFKTIASYNLWTNDYQNFSGNKQRYYPDGTKVALANYDARYQLSISGSQNNTLAVENYLTYNWRKSIHNLTLMAGNSESKSYGNWTSVGATDFPGDNIRDVNLTSDITTKTAGGAYNLQVRGVSYFGRAEYSLMDRYVIKGTIRRDGSSNFGAENQFGTFPSASAAWRISEENFMKGITSISNLKLRLGWGKTGNSGGPTDKAVAALTSDGIAYYFYSQNGIAGLGSTAQTANGYASTLVDTKLKWETNAQTNVGVDLGLLQNSLNVTVDYFVRKTTDLLNKKAIRPSTGFTEVYTNYGEVENKGIEFSLDYKKNINRDWNFGATLTGSTIKSKIINVGPDILFSNTDGGTGDGSNKGAVGANSEYYWTGHSISREGYAIGSFYGYVVEGVFQSQAEIDGINAKAKAAGHDRYDVIGSKITPGDFKFKDVNGDGFVDEKDRVILGDGFPKLNFGLNLNASYKNWDLLIFSYGVLGQKINSYSAMILSNIYSGDNGTLPNILKESADNAWTPENHSNTHSKLSIIDYNINRRASTDWIKKGDFLKIGTLQLGYNLNKNMLKPLGIESARFNVSVQNLLCISPYNKYGDPEVGQGSVLYTGLDTGRYPNPRTYTFGVNVQF